MHSILPAATQELILADLSSVGFQVASVSALRNSGVRYGDAVPVLLSWLPRIEDPKLKGEVVRALSVPWAKPVATRPLIDQFRSIPEDVDPTGFGLRWIIGNALDVLFDDSFFSEYVELAEDTRYGFGRQMVVLGLGKSKRPEAVGVLLSLVDDPDVDGHAIKALCKLRAPLARAAFEAKLSDQRTWVRAEARKGLSRLASRTTA